MNDRISEHPGRVTLTPVAGQENTFDMVRADQPTQEGTPLNKATLLSDEVAEAIGLTSEDPTVNEALSRIGERVDGLVDNVAKVTVLVAFPDGTPAQGVEIAGFSINGENAITNVDGIAAWFISPGDTSFTYKTAYDDIAEDTESYSFKAGNIYTIEKTLAQVSNIEITESRNIIFSRAIENKDITVTCVGGGGGGAARTTTYEAGYRKLSGGGGGGGGYINSAQVSISPGTSYPAVIGSGGPGGVAVNANGTDGGTTSFAGISAEGGKGGTGHTGGNGGGKGGVGGYLTAGETSVTYRGGDGGEGSNGFGGGGGGGGTQYYIEYGGGYYTYTQPAKGNDGGGNGAGVQGYYACAKSTPGSNGTGGGGGGGATGVNTDGTGVNYTAEGSGSSGGSGRIIITIPA